MTNPYGKAFCNIKLRSEKEVYLYDIIYFYGTSQCLIQSNYNYIIVKSDSLPIEN